MASNQEQPAEPTPAAPAAPAAPEASEAPAAEASTEAAAEKKPELTPEEKAKKRAERLEKLKEKRKAAREAAKEARAAGEPPKPRAPKADKAKPGEIEVPEGAAPKITVARIPATMTVAELKTMFEKYGTVLSADLSKRKGRPNIGTIFYNTNADVRRAAAALHGKHTCPGEQEPISIQYAKNAKELGDSIKKSTDAVADCLKEYKYKPTVLRSKDAKDFLNRLLARRNPPATEIMAAALLVHTNSATAQELVDCKMIQSASRVQQLVQDEKANAPSKQGKEQTKPAAKAAAAAKVEKTFDAVVPSLDKLEKERWNRMAKANLRFNERHRFRFVDILATPSLELWRWMVEDCELTPAEAGTCFNILQNYYGFAK